MTFEVGNNYGNRDGRPAGKRNISVAKTLEMVTMWIEEGNFQLVADRLGYQRRTVSGVVRRWIKNNPEEYNKMLDAFLMRNKQELIFKNAHTTKKALNKVDELLDDTESLKEAAMAYGILYDKGALMKGEATQNSAVIVKIDGLEELSK